MGHWLDETNPPADEIYRVGWHSAPLDPPPWELALEDGSFGNRFDDPRAAEGFPVEERFRCVYLGTTAAAAFGETLDQFRVSIDQLDLISASVNDAESIEEIFGDVFDFADPNVPARGIIRANWRDERRLTPLILDPALRIADLGSAQSLKHLQYRLTAEARRAGLNAVDFPAIMSKSNRAFTQECARYIYEISDQDGEPVYHGIRYLSRLDPVRWECWALFADRIADRYSSGYPQTITADQPALCEVAQVFDLSIEVVSGNEKFLRP